MAGKGRTGRKKTRTRANLTEAQILRQKHHDTGLTHKQRIFVAEYAVKMEAKAAAIKAGCNPDSASQVAAAWLNPNKFPLVAAAVEKAIALKEQVAEYKADDVLRELQRGAFINALAWFRPGNVKKGTWRINEFDLAALPEDIQRLIVSCERAKEEGELVLDEDGAQVYEVRLVNKEEMLALVAKHMLGDKLNVSGQVVQINWDGLGMPPAQLVEQRRQELDDEAVKEAIRGSIVDGRPEKSADKSDSNPKARQALPAPRDEVDPELGI